LQLDADEPDLASWTQMVRRVLEPAGRVRVAIIGKYTELTDAYTSIREALVHGGIANEVGVDLNWIPSDECVDPEATTRILSGHDALLVPGGFGVRGVEGMVEAIRWAREQEVPFFGICLGMQCASIEFARNACRLPNTNSSEFAPECEHPVVSLMDSQRDVQDLGGTMRLGAYPCRLTPDSKAHDIYGADEVSERHRHRYEVNNRYRDVLAENGLRGTGLSPNGALVEMVELDEHPWFIGCQFHPELRSRPTRPHPLFASFVRAALEYRKRQSGSAASLAERSG
jgi:CTP synthase